MPLGDLTGERRVGAVRQRAIRRACVALALLVPLGALAVACGPVGAPPRAGVHAADALAAHVPSVGALRTLRARDVATPGTLRGALAWTFALLSVALSSALGRRRSHLRLAAPIRTRAPPDLRLV